MLSGMLYDMVKKKNPAAVALGKLGGKKASKSMTKEQKTERAKKAAVKRWENHPKKAKV
jgi:hypothetical protein